MTETTGLRLKLPDNRFCNPAWSAGIYSAGALLTDSFNRNPDDDSNSADERNEQSFLATRGCRAESSVRSGMSGLSITSVLQKMLEPNHC